MKSDPFRGPRGIIAGAAILYAALMTVSWLLVTARADRRAESILVDAEDYYREVVYGEIDAALRNVGGALINQFGGVCTPQSIERMKRLAEAFNLDEINLVNREGIVVASNVKAVLGVDFRHSPLTSEFLALTNETVTCVAQPLRRGTVNPEMRCVYYGVAFPHHNGFIQVGISDVRLRQNMYAFTPAESREILRNFNFSVEGWYELADERSETGTIFRRWSEEEKCWVLGRTFVFDLSKLTALLPESYCYSQRNFGLMCMALFVGAVFAFFAFFLIRLAHASEKLEALHAAADRRAAADLQLARKIQMSTLPPSEGPFVDRLEFSFAAEMRPAREVGGDFYDFGYLPGGRLGFLVADVSGKGIPGAMFMMEAKNILRAALAEFADLAEAVARANVRLCAANKAELFVTCFVAALNPRTGEVEYVNAGHNRPFLRRADGRVEKVMGKGGRFLGMFEDAAYRSHALRLSPGDLLYLYTDGVTEAMNAASEQFGEKRLCAALAEDGERVSEALAQFVGAAEQSDDRTSLALRWNGVPERRTETFPCGEKALAPALAFLRAALAGVAAKSVAALLNAADEIVSNVVNYSGAETFDIGVERSFDRVRLTFADAGTPYNPLSHVDPDTHAPLEDRPIGGLGLVVVKRLVDGVSYAHENGRNVLTLLKRIPLPSSRPARPC